MNYVEYFNMVKQNVAYNEVIWMQNKYFMIYPISFSWSRMTLLCWCICLDMINSCIFISEIFF
jgi:hypothetical protein